MTDIAVVFNAATSTFDWQIVNGDLADTAAAGLSDLQSSVVISLFTDRVAQPDYKLPSNTIDQRGHWSDIYEPSPLGSWLWQLKYLAGSSSSLQIAKTMCDIALKWLIDGGIVSTIAVHTSWLRANDTSKMLIRIDMTEPVTKKSSKFQFAWAWQQVAVPLAAQAPNVPAAGVVFDAASFDGAVFS